MKDRELEIGITQIGTWKVEKDDTIYQVFFGNYLFPHRNNEFHHLEYNDYTNVLNDFLESEEGKSYRHPTDAEKRKAIKVVLEKENEALERFQSAKKEKEDTKPLVKEEMSGDDVLIQDTASGILLKESNVKEKKRKEKEPKTLQMYKKQAGVLLITTAFLSLLVLYQMLLNLYLVSK